MLKSIEGIELALGDIVEIVESKRRFEVVGLNSDGRVWSEENGTFNWAYANILSFIGD